MNTNRTMMLVFFLAVASTSQLSSAQALDMEQAQDCVIKPKSTVKLGSPEQGILAEVFVTRGDRVKKGDLLAKLDTGVEELEAELAKLRAQNTVDIRSGQAQFEYRKKEASRLVTLRVNKTVPESKYDEAVIEERLAQLQVDSAKTQRHIAEVEYQRAKAHLDRRSIRSPVDGVIVDVNLSPGEYVYEQTPIMSIAEIDPLYVEVFLPVTRYGSVKAGMQAEVRPEEPLGGNYRAKVMVVDDVFDPASRTFGVRLEMPNTDYALPAGLRCTVQFPRDDVTQVDKDHGIPVAK